MNQKPKDYETDAAWEACYKSTTCDACRIASQAGPGTIPALSRRTRHKLGTTARMVLPHARARSIVDRPPEPRGAVRTNAFVFQLHPESCSQTVVALIDVTPSSMPLQTTLWPYESPGGAVPQRSRTDSDPGRLLSVRSHRLASGCHELQFAKRPSRRTFDERSVHLMRYSR